MSNEVVRTVELTKRFGKTTALAGLSFSMAEHSITGLVGRNGSGKTTLLKILAGLLDKSGGEALVWGEKPLDNMPILNKLIYTYHNVNYDSSLRLNSILFAYQTMFPNFDADFAGKLMKYFELDGKKRYKHLSQGMASVFNFLCALSCRAELTMFDEPVLGMDVGVRKSVYAILLRDFSEHPRTFIISSHLLSEIEGVLSDILLIEKGQTVLHNSLDELRQSAYRIDGEEARIASFIADKRTIAKKCKGLASFAVIYEPYNDESGTKAMAQGLTVSPVRAEDLCVYLTRQDKEEEFECLW
jgi:ABC-2 type transport system ATP-binding protein